MVTFDFDDDTIKKAKALHKMQQMFAPFETVAHPQLHVRIHWFLHKVCPCPGLWEEVHDGEGLAPGAALGTPVLLGPAWEQSRGLGLH